METENMNQDKVERITPTRLKERGWTQTMIKRLLGAPDVLATNPNYRSGPPMRLYDLSRVEAAEGGNDFIELRRKAETRSAIASAVADRKRHELLEEVRDIRVNVKSLTLKQLTAAAVESYNWRNNHRIDHQPATVGSDGAFLDRIRVNHARHALTTYDERLDALFARIGRRAAESAIRKATYEAIADAWPELRDECDRQLSDRAME